MSEFTTDYLADLPENPTRADYLRLIKSARQYVSVWRRRLASRKRDDIAARPVTRTRIEWGEAKVAALYKALDNFEAA